MHEPSTHLALLLDAPLQSWGYQSKFDRRTSFSSPTRSGILGMLCAAMGVDRADSETLAEFADLEITVYTLQNNGRLTDFHTVGGGWNKKTHKRNIVPKADGGVGNTVVTRREYLQSSIFGVVLRGPRTQLEPIGEALQNPRWGIWLGRKACIPASPVMQGLFDTEEAALQHLCQQAGTPNASRVCREAASFEDGTDTLMDTPLNFAERSFAPRRIAVE